ncbi:MAG: cation diffusion facilitator family transporter [Jatrophihabitans sp.]
MSAEGGSKAVVAALGANLGIAVLKFIAFGITRSSSMLAEGVHSLVDSGNQVLLLVGGKRARRVATDEHPFGYGRDRYVYGFLVALVLFTLGGMFALYEGVEKVLHPHEIDKPAVAIAVLIGGIGLESFSLRTAVKESLHAKGEQSWISFIRRSKAPELPVVLLEDVAALIGLALAMIGISIAAATGEGVWDGVGTLAIGALLVSVAVILVVETKSLLLGESANAPTRQEIADALVGGAVDRVIHLRTLHLGPEELLVAAKIAVGPTDSAVEVAAAIDAAEARVRERVPIARVIYLEPDIDRNPD